MKKKKGKEIARDVSWMYFNHRILEEAQRPDVPLLERVSFMGIYSNNLDEFFRVRVAGISRVIEYSDSKTAAEAAEAKSLLKRINKLNAQYASEYSKTMDDIHLELAKNKIFILDDSELDSEQRSFVYDFFRAQLAGHIVPVWYDLSYNLKDNPDNNIHFVVRLCRKAAKRAQYAFIEMPSNVVGRFLRLPDRDGASYVMYIDDVIRCCLPLIFPGLRFDTYEAYSFKYTKDAEMEIDNDLRKGFMEKISKGVKSRRRGLPLRVIYDKNMPKAVFDKVLAKLSLEKYDTVVAAGKYQNHRDLMSFPDFGRTDLKYPKWPALHKAEFVAEQSIFQTIYEKDRLLHVPYNSFDGYIRLLQEAAINPAVKSVKATLYRLAKHSKVVQALICAALNGKKVTVVIELLARFDEASNIGWSKLMQDAGVKVIFGVEGLKVHSKLTYIGMKRGRDIACISTGNFHEGNAKAYTDCLMFTSNSNIVRDVEGVFDYIEEPFRVSRFKHLLVSPNEMKRKFISLINDEIRNHRAGKPAYIKIKINHITDRDMVAKLYEASSEGVAVDMVLRGNCSLVTGQPGISDTMHINGIIDRYLEHSRIFIFAAGGEERCFMGSADWMTRNLEYRIEVVTPVYDPDIKKELHRIVDFGLLDTAQGRVVDGTGRNMKWQVEGTEEEFRSQERLYQCYREEAEQEQKTATNDDSGRYSML